LRLIPSHDNTIIVNLGLFSSFTTSVDTITLGVDPTPSNPPPSSNVMHVDTMVSSAPKEDIIEIHEELKNLHNQMSIELISTTAISTLENKHCMIEREEIFDLMQKIVPIFVSCLNPKFFCPLNIITSQRGMQISPPTTIASIFTYTNPQLTLKMQLKTSVVPSLGVFSISLILMWYHISYHLPPYHL
jgi:hypothetical protein